MERLRLTIAAPDGDLARGFLTIGDRGKAGIRLELWPARLNQLPDWLGRFPGASFCGQFSPEQVMELFRERNIKAAFDCEPQAVYLGERQETGLPDSIQLRPLTYADKAAVLQWAGDARDGYVLHLLREADYRDAATLEYGAFEGDALLAVAGCGVDEVRGLRMNDCCQIRFAHKKATAAGYRGIFLAVVNELLSKGILPWETRQFGDCAAAHGGFTAVDAGFTIVNYRYSCTSGDERPAMAADFLVSL